MEQHTYRIKKTAVPCRYYKLSHVGVQLNYLIPAPFPMYLIPVLFPRQGMQPESRNTATIIRFRLQHLTPEWGQDGGSIYRAGPQILHNHATYPCRFLVSSPYCW